MNYTDYVLNKRKGYTMENEKFKRAMKIVLDLEQRDYESNENKIEVYRASSARFELLAKLAEEGFFNE